MLIALSLNAQTITVTEQSRSTSIRGLSVVDDRVAWVSGSKGNIGISTDGGTTWQWQQVKGFEQSDLRDIEAFSDKDAVVMSSGTPAVILKTTDGGKTWKECFRNSDQAWFLDGLDFYDSKNGIVMGDPIDGKFVIMSTTDGGDTWTSLDHRPEARKDEAAFAASGTTIKMTGKRSIAMISGGSSSRLFTTKDQQHWSVKELPILQGRSTTGAFSFITVKDKFVFVGGDYQKNMRKDSTACYLLKDGSMQLSQQMPAGFQSCVENLDKNILLSTGTSGTNLSTDGGITWKPIDTNSYNVCRKAKHGKLVLLAGDKGKIARLKP
ncbi:YCF48-related protein [Mucilaginibacter daejeonensis]|uniref:WD40/YVTN/BNR-like repeat-containing protein n=1 Tax=Mucilaginibacter daejeonensis TaxID=398049 RepID=UPI001D17BD7A|nr:YCF48-related protein [Mucilaginibacter daejeonensis]UEG54511.1 YCF48-related protein [Mucilaginibacter daejeonensis]